MKTRSHLSALLVAFFGLISLQTQAAQESLRLNRSATTGARLEGTLSRDVYRTVPYQETYEEEEAYQVEETYYVDVPYQEQESYLDTEYYYENEYRCQTVTEYERECQTERLCSREPGDDVCQEVEECGQNSRGEPICKVRKVCSRGPDRENCRDQYTCHDVPRNREKCGYEQVQKSRTVTKWRTVTKYRQEARTRTVTRYRTVTKCCVTRYREEYVRTWDLKIQVILPEQAILLENETEQFELTLKGTEAQPDADLRAVNTIFGYKIARKDILKGSGQIELALTPKYNDQNLGEKLLEKVELLGPDENSFNEIQLKDKGIVPRVQTAYRYRVIEVPSQGEVASGELQSSAAVKGIISARLPVALPGDVDYIVQIAATRSGVVLEKPLSFTTTRKVEFNRWKAEEFGEKTIKNLLVSTQNGPIKLHFQDEGAHPKLVTQYRVVVLKESGQQLSVQDFVASEVLDINNQARLPLDQQAMSLKENLVVQLLVQRTGRRLDKVVQFQKSLKYPYLSLEEMRDRKKISNPTIEGAKSNLRLLFKDAILDSDRVTTEYSLVIKRRGGFLGLEKKVLADLRITQSKMNQGSFNELLIDLGIRGKDLDRYADSGATLYVDLTAVRKSAADKTTLATVRKSVELQVQ